MKKILLLSSILVFHCSLSFGQFNVYHPFPDSNAYWTVNTLTGGDFCYAYTYDYYLKGDTTLNGYKYHQLRYSGGLYYPDCEGYVVYDKDYLEGFLREDTARHVFYMPQNGKKDTLLYDFNLKVGELLPATYNNYVNLDSNRVYKIDSVLIGKTYRKQFLIISGHDTNHVYGSIIEGIGSALGLIQGIMPFFESGSYLICFSQNGKPLYPDTNTWCESFYLSVNNIKKEEQPEITIYPNPSNGKFAIRVKSEELRTNSAVEIYNMLGERIYSLSFTPDSYRDHHLAFSIDLSSQPSGIYYCRLLIDGTAGAVSKLVIIR